MPVLKTRKSPLLKLYTSLAFLLLAGCASNPDKAITTSTPSPPSSQLITSSWTAELIFDQKANATQSTLTFMSNAIISGNAGCNNYNGTVKLASTSIKVGLLATTRMMCEPAINGQETVFLEALGAAKVWRLTGSTLELTDEKNIRVMKLTRKASTKTP
ncbi:MAG: META domain-containing protein [Gammaproteobacteria bacterium]|nr:META domain-containing protein [Gammaproteobacteria bacterium]MCP4089216.1 META domain-containing protein [Gammaproteobacteria bacterium]MCP4276760.1 META domain-containing protein [Gammaproteobacteria bacterium]MCP4830603.1 META domain-containing protein [Gammaproteobacteria bacterium]MCP4928412.1 META domain-containing protein [Gammaproteobacteria bacterium]